MSPESPLQWDENGKMVPLGDLPELAKPDAQPTAKLQTGERTRRRYRFDGNLKVSPTSGRILAILIAAGTILLSHWIIDHPLQTLAGASLAFAVWQSIRIFRRG